MKLELKNVTLIGVDCIELKRLQVAAEISTKEINFGAVKLLTSIKSDDTRVIPIPHLGSAQSYSDFMIKDLHKYIDTEFALVFQYDGFVLDPSAWSPEFLKYDYIGSVWHHLGETKVGNGGFSLRSKKLLDWLGQNWKNVPARIHPEDVFISKFARPQIEQAGMKFADENIANRFSMEGTEHGVVWNGEFGFHGITYTDISKWLVDHSEYKELLDYPLDDYVTLMKKYPVHDGTIHDLKFRKQNMQEYAELSENKRNYETRLATEQYEDYENIKVGDTIVFRRWSVSFEDVPIPAFEKKVEKIESFNTLRDLRNTYPNMHITYPIKEIPKWKRPFIKILGDSIYPKDKKYLVFWF